jgi:hypothetical protein
VLFFEGLEGTVAELRGGVDELELHLLQVPTRCVDHERFAEGDNTLLGSWDRALDDKEVVLDDTVVGEATHGGDDLLGNIGLGGCVALVASSTDTVDLLVELRSVVVTV